MCAAQHDGDDGGHVDANAHGDDAQHDDISDNEGSDGRGVRAAEAGGGSGDPDHDEMGATDGREEGTSNMQDSRDHHDDSSDAAHDSANDDSSHSSREE